MRSSLLVFALPLALIAACGGSTSSETPPPGGSPGDVDSGAQLPPPPPPKSDSGAPVADAGDPGSEAYPAAHHPIPQMKNYGGPVLKDMKIITVTFAGDALRDQIRAFDAMILKTPWWAAVTRGFGINAGQNIADVELDPADVANKALDNDKDLKPLIRKWVAAGQLPAPDANTIYAIFFPASTTISLGGSQSCQAFGAYHDSYPLDPNAPDAGPDAAAGPEAAFAVMPRCGGSMAELTASASHEYIEAATDPHPQVDGTYYLWNLPWAGGQGGESADLCEGRGPADESGYTVAKSWVNKAAAESKDPCQPQDPGEIYFGAAVETSTVTVHDAQNGDYDSDGFILVKRGETKVVDVVVFSEAKLPHDLDLVVGKRANANDPHQVGAIATGVTATLSQTSGARNGQKVQLTIKVDASAAVADKLFVVRAILETNDYHSWPVILRIQ